MKIEVLKEAGYEEAVEGLSYNFNTSVEKAHETTSKLFNKDHGHNKFMRFIFVWMRISAPRYWWSQFDQYHFAETNSESTMHTLLKQPLTQDMFEKIHSETLVRLEALRQQGDLVSLKQELPESFIQKRMVVLNYAQLREMIIQRKNHKLSEWKDFCSYVQSNCEHVELLGTTA